MQLKYLEEIVLKKVDSRNKRPNGTFDVILIEDGIFKTQIQSLTDEVSVSIYGADIDKVLRLRTPNKGLEKYLMAKVNNDEDNISKYFVYYNNAKYKINSVNSAKIDIQRL